MKTPRFEDITYLEKYGLSGPNITLKRFAESSLRAVTGMPVVNETGIEGRFTIKLKYAPEGAVDSPLPSIYTALEEQLGLKLVTRKIPLDVIVVDHVDREPVEN